MLGHNKLHTKLFARKVHFRLVFPCFYARLEAQSFFLLRGAGCLACAASLKNRPVYSQDRDLLNLFMNAINSARSCPVAVLVNGKALDEGVQNYTPSAMDVISFEGDGPSYVWVGGKWNPVP